MSTTLDALNTIYEQVKNKDDWCQGGLFSKDGSKVCLVGRLYSINDLDRKSVVRNRLYEALSELKEPLELDVYNDTHTHAEILQLVVRAVAIEKRAINDQQKNSSSTKIS